MGETINHPLWTGGSDYFFLLSKKPSAISSSSMAAHASSAMELSTISFDDVLSDDVSSGLLYGVVQARNLFSTSSGT